MGHLAAPGPPEPCSAYMNPSQPLVETQANPQSRSLLLLKQARSLPGEVGTTAGPSVPKTVDDWQRSIAYNRGDKAHGISAGFPPSSLTAKASSTHHLVDAGWICHWALLQTLVGGAGERRAAQKRRKHENISVSRGGTNDVSHEAKGLARAGLTGSFEDIARGRRHCSWTQSWHWTAGTYRPCTMSPAGIAW